MSYTDMDIDDLLGVLRTHCKEVAEIAHALNKCLVVIANGKGSDSTYNIIDTDPTEEVARG